MGQQLQLRAKIIKQGAEITAEDRYKRTEIAAAVQDVKQRAAIIAESRDSKAKGGDCSRG